MSSTREYSDKPMSRLQFLMLDAVEQGGCKYIRVKAFDPGGNINEQRKTGCMTFRKSITPKSFQLPEYS